MYENIVQSFEKKNVRPICKDKISVKLYRLLPSFVTWEEIIKEKGSTKDILITLYNFGRFLGKDIGNYLTKNKKIINMNSLSEAITDLLGPNDWNIGFITIKECTNKGFKLKIRENAACVGIEPKGYSYCTFETGLLAGMVEGALGIKASCFESECLVAGHDHCEFVVITEEYH